MRNFPWWLRWLVSGILAGWALFQAQPVAAYVIQDLQPGLTWEELLHSKLIVVATAEPVANDRVRLQVQKVLAGNALKAGDHAEVVLAHWYAVQWHDARDAFENPERRYLYMGGPFLGAGQFGPDQIVYCAAGEQIYHGIQYGDMHKPLVYCFPTEKLELMQLRQIQRGELAPDWEAALAPGGKASLFLRILEGWNQNERTQPVRDDAIAELRKSRDSKTLERLMSWMFDPPERPGYSIADSILLAAGDVNGDVVGPLINKYDTTLKANPTLYQGEIARIAVMLDPDAGFAAFSKRAVEGPGEEQAIAALAWAPNEKCVDFLMQQLKQAKHAKAIAQALESILNANPNRSLVRPRVEGGMVKALRARALPGLREAANLPGLEAVKPQLEELTRKIAPLFE